MREARNGLFLKLDKICRDIADIIKVNPQQTNCCGVVFSRKTDFFLQAAWDMQLVLAITLKPHLFIPLVDVTNVSQNVLQVLSPSFHDSRRNCGLMLLLRGCTAIKSWTCRSLSLLLHLELANFYENIHNMVDVCSKRNW